MKLSRKGKDMNIEISVRNLGRFTLGEVVKKWGVEQGFIFHGNIPAHYTSKSDSHLPKKTFFICFNNSPSKMMKNAFYFILKALFFLKIFIFLSGHFGHVEKTA